MFAMIFTLYTELVLHQLFFLEEITISLGYRFMFGILGQENTPLLVIRSMGQESYVFPPNPIHQSQ